MKKSYWVVQRRLNLSVGTRLCFLFLLPFSFVSHFPHRSFFSLLFKPIKAKPRVTMLQFRETLQESRKAFAAMDWISPGRQTDRQTDRQTSASLAKMHLIQFPVIMNLIQLKPMKGSCNH
jgi:hypothetical protein